MNLSTSVVTIDSQIGELSERIGIDLQASNEEASYCCILIMVEVKHVCLLEGTFAPNCMTTTGNAIVDHESHVTTIRFVTRQKSSWPECYRIGTAHCMLRLESQALLALLWGSCLRCVRPS